MKLVFAVRIEIANPDGVFKPGMPADAVVALRPREQADDRRAAVPPSRCRGPFEELRTRARGQRA